VVSRVVRIADEGAAAGEGVLLLHHGLEELRVALRVLPRRLEAAGLLHGEAEVAAVSSAVPGADVDLAHHGVADVPGEEAFEAHARKRCIELRQGQNLLIVYDALAGCRFAPRVDPVDEVLEYPLPGPGREVEKPVDLRVSFPGETLAPGAGGGAGVEGRDLPDGSGLCHLRRRRSCRLRLGAGRGRHYGRRRGAPVHGCCRRGVRWHRRGEDGCRIRRRGSKVTGNRSLCRNDGGGGQKGKRLRCRRDRRMCCCYGQGAVVVVRPMRPGIEGDCVVAAAAATAVLVIVVIVVVVSVVAGLARMDVLISARSMW